MMDADDAGTVPDLGEGEGEGESPNGEQTPGSSSTNKPTAAHTISCFRCRHRKIRCDRQDPCQSCIQVGAECSYPASRRSAKKRQRLLLSSHQAQQIDHIEKRLEEVAASLDRLTKSLPLRLPAAAATPASAPLFASNHEFGDDRSIVASTVTSPEGRAGAASGSSQATTDTKGPTAKVDFEQDPSLTAHALFTKDFLHNVIGNGTLCGLQDDVGDAVDSLRLLVDAQKQHSSSSYETVYTHKRSTPPGLSIRDLPLPPIELVVSVLRMVKDSRVLRFQWFAEFMTVPLFTEYFLKVYSPGGDVTYADLIILNAGLYWVFRSCSGVDSEKSRAEEYMRHAAACRDNLETVLAALPFQLPTTLEYACALTMACQYCLEICQPSVAWIFIITASNISQALGCHSLALMTNDDYPTRKVKMDLFWFIYCHEKSLALRLGRCSTIQDYVISIPLPQVPVDSRNYFRPKWIGICRVQAKIHEEIYSPTALAKDDAVRIASSKSLVQELLVAMHAVTAEEHTHRQARRAAVGDKVDALLESADMLINYSTLALIYRAIPMPPNSPTSFCEECITASRKALETHRKCVELIVEINMELFDIFIDWSMMYSPFVPFMVLFCHSIETSHPDDLKFLEGFICTLKKWKTFVNEAAMKQHRLFQVLFNVARKYTDVKTASHREQLQSQAERDFNTYLNALGLAPFQILPGQDGSQGFAASPSVGTSGGMDEMASLNPTAASTPANQARVPQQSGSHPSQQLSPWYYNNQQAFNIMNEDCTQ